MTTATRLDTDMANWAPITRHYEVDGGHLAVTVNRFLTATGTDVFYCDEGGGVISLEPLIRYPDGTTHTQALENLGYTVVDTIGDEPEPETTQQLEIVQQSVLDMLPAPIAAMVTQALEEQ